MNTFQTNDGTHLAYEQHGSGEKALVFIHGACLNRNAWQPQRSALAGRSYLLLDLRGHGQSDRRGYPYRIATFADDVVQLLTHLRWKQVTLVGHSLGGMVAQYVATYYPDMVARLVLADTSYGMRSTRVESWLTTATLPLFNLTPVSWQAKLFANQLGQRSEETKRYVGRTVGQHVHDPKNYRQIWKAVTSFDGFDDLDKISVPTLIVVGALNQQTHRQAQRMNERITGSRWVVIRNAGYLLSWDNSEQFNRVLLSFITQS